MTLLCYDPLFLQHKTGNHPEQPLRISATYDHLEKVSLIGQCQLGQWNSATDEQLAAVHDLDYVRQIRDYAGRGGGRIEADTLVSAKSFEAAAMASGAVIHAVDEVVQGREPNALCLIRPPGHHARPAAAMGFCLFNHIAVAAKYAVDELHLDRVLVIDWDVHHGNGTQESFYESENIGFVSVHRWPFYPGTGTAAETGTGAGLGATINVPIAFGTPRGDYEHALKSAIDELATRMKPQLILLSAGFDAHRLDPVGSLNLEVEDFVWMTQYIRQVADEYCQGKLVSMLEGGYNTEILPQCVEVHLRELLA